MATTPKAERKKSLETALTELADEWREASIEAAFEASGAWWGGGYADQLLDVLDKHS